MRCTPVLVVSDVVSSSTWYQRVLGLESGHGGNEFEMLMQGGDFVIYLHHEDVEEHPTLARGRGEIPGGGVLLYFSVADVDAIHERAVAAGAELFDEPHDNPLSHAREFSMCDPDGYGITVAQYGTR